MRTSSWLLLGLLVLVSVGSWVAAEIRLNATTLANDAPGYLCPLTGEELPCPHCCPLNAITE